jgi:hypothetical protein
MTLLISIIAVWYARVDAIFACWVGTYNVIYYEMEIGEYSLRFADYMQD